MFGQATGSQQRLKASITWTFPIGSKTTSLTIPGGEPSQKEMDVIITILQDFKSSLPQGEDE